jgi:hypothetical protein
MIDEHDKSKKAGTFRLPSGKDIYGELTLAGKNTSLYLQDKDAFDSQALSAWCVRGILNDMTKVTLAECITTSGTGHSTRGDGYYFASLFPHYVIYGEHHIEPADAKITAVHFVVDDATKLFYDFDAFSCLTSDEAGQYIEQIVNSRRIWLKREVPIGPHPEMLYFTGKREIFATDTALGRISASHRPIINFGLDGLFLKNTIFVTIAFGGAVTFEVAIRRTLILVRYFEILIGRPQNVLRTYIDVESNEELPISLQVYWSMPPKRGESFDSDKPEPGDVLLDAISQPELFSHVLANWLERQETWRDARMRFSISFRHQDSYGVDRLIGSANMFDILPGSAVPPEIEISEELRQAKNECRWIFTRLPDSPERASILSALGRIGKSALKQKIRHRGQIVVHKVGGAFPDLFMVTDEAVNCRNHYVHGSEPTFDYENNFNAVTFLTDTLEFVFAASDLIEAGWDIKTWSRSPKGMSHPFGRYLITYGERLRVLKTLLV